MLQNQWKQIEAKLNDLLEVAGERFTSAEQQEVNEFVNLREYGLALETFCSIAAEARNPIDNDIKRRVILLHELMGCESQIVHSWIEQA